MVSNVDNFLAAILISLVDTEDSKTFFKKGIYCTVCECISSLVKLGFCANTTRLLTPTIATVTVTQQTPPKGFNRYDQEYIWYDSIHF